MAETSYYIMLDGNKDIFGQKILRDKDNNLYGMGFSSSTNMTIQDKTYSRNSSTHAGFIVKFDSYGRCEWFNWIVGSTNDDYVKLYGITNDSNDEIYITGHTNASRIIINNKSYDKKDKSKGSFVVKFDEKGKLIWLEWIDSDQNDLSYAIVCDSSNYLYIIGKTNSTEINGNIRPIISTPSTPSPSYKFNDYSGYLIKMDSSSREIKWIKWIDGVENDETTTLAIDSLDNIFIAGNSHSSKLKIDELDIIKNHTNKAIYLAKFNKEGTIQNLKWVDGDATNSLHSVSLKSDTFNNIYLLGYTKSKNIIIDEQTFSQLNNNVMPFVVKFDNSLEVEWIKLIEGNEHNYANAINTDIHNNLYMSGTTLSKNIIVNEIKYENVSDNENAYLIKLNHRGETEWFRWFENYENNKTIFVKDILVDKHNFIYLNSYTNGTDIYFNNNMLSFLNNNLYKTFILKYDLNEILNEDNIYYIDVIYNNNNNYSLFYLILVVVYIYAIWLLYKTIN